MVSLSIITTLTDYLATNYLELLAASVSLLTIYLNTQETVWAWPVGLVSVVLYAYIYFDYALISDGILNVIYFALGIYGWYQWASTSQNNHQRLPISRESRPRTIGLLVACIPITWLWAQLILVVYPEASFLYGDSATTVYSLLAQYWVAKKRIENWLLWIVVDLVASYIYFQKGLWITTVLYLLFTGLAVYGYYTWRKKLLAYQARPA